MQGILAAIAAVWFSLLSVIGLPQSVSRFPARTEDRPLHIIAFGDSGTGDAKQRQLARVMERYPADVLIHTGDVAYPRGTADELQKYFFDIYASLIAKADVLPSPGNHDYLTDDLGPYRARFQRGRYYAVDRGPVHFVSLDTNMLGGTEMTDWLSRDLSAVPKDRWVIVFFHHPPYSSGTQHGGSKAVREKIVPILQKYRVALVLSGHEHNYERIQPGDGIVYAVTGGGSGNLYGFGLATPGSVVRMTETHFLKLTATRCLLDARAVAADDTVIDTFTLQRCK